MGSSNDIIRLLAEKNAVYSERNKLVALIAAIYPSSLERHQPENDLDWEKDWKWVVIIDTPAGQVSFHINDSELELFSHLPRQTGREWDGHSTEEKYRRIAVLCVNHETQALHEIEEVLHNLRTGG